MGSIWEPYDTKRAKISNWDAPDATLGPGTHKCTIDGLVIGDNKGEWCTYMKPFQGDLGGPKILHVPISKSKMVLTGQFCMGQDSLLGVPDVGARSMGNTSKAAA